MDMFTALDGGDLFLVQTPAYEKGTDRLLSINYQKVRLYQAWDPDWSFWTFPYIIFMKSLLKKICFCIIRIIRKKGKIIFFTSNFADLTPILILDTNLKWKLGSIYGTGIEVHIEGQNKMP